MCIVQEFELCGISEAMAKIQRRKEAVLSDPNGMSICHPMSVTSVDVFAVLRLVLSAISLLN